MKEFSRKDNLSRHQANCVEMRINHEKLKYEIINLKKMNDVLNNELRFNKNVTSNAGIIMSQAFKFLNATYKNAPPIQPIKLEAIMEGEEDITSVENFIFLYRKKRFVNFLGDIIVDQYKTENPEDQSIWSSDVARLNYIIREIIDKNPEWNTDKSGLKVRNIIVEPLTKKINDLIISYIKWKTDRILTSHEEEAIESVEIFNTASEILAEIKNKTLEKEIMRNITPKFQMMKKLKN